MPSRGVAIEFCRPWTSHWGMLHWATKDSSTEDIWALSLARGDTAKFVLRFNLDALQHVNAEKVLSGRLSTDGKKDEIKSVCVFKGLAVWGQGREGQRGRLDRDA